MLLPSEVKEWSRVNSTSWRLNYMHWYGLATFLHCPYRPDLEHTDIGLIGVPYSGGNQIERMQYLGPRAVRNRSGAYHRAHREFGINPFELVRVRDLGDAPILRVLNPDMAAEDFQAYYERVFAAGITPVSVGGDHSITWPILRAPGARATEVPVGMIHFDSHTDAYPAAEATRNHAAGFRIGTEDGIIDPDRTVQIGIAARWRPSTRMTGPRRTSRIITTEEFVDRGVDHVREEVRRVIGDGPAYLSFDLDALDPAYAPGVADPELDGLTLREVMKLLQRAERDPLDGGRFRGATARPWTIRRRLPP